MIRSAVVAGAALAVAGALGLGAGVAGTGGVGPGGVGPGGLGPGGVGPGGVGPGGADVVAGRSTPAGAPSPPAAPPAAPLAEPVVVVQPFDGPPQPWAPGHRGVDLAAHAGQAVRASASGVVTFAGTVVDRGVVTVTHDDGLRSSLEPLVPSVTVGQRVVQGQVVGSVADVPGHCRPAACLHWGLRRGTTYLDPMDWLLGPRLVVLLPER